MHHVASGPEDAPVLLLGGSLGSTVAMWDPQVRALSETLRVVCFDHRGHGGSPVPAGPYSMEGLAGDVIALMDRLGVERAHYAGLSLGGMVGQWLALHHPERIDRLALLGATPFSGPPEPWRERAATVRDQGPGALADTLLGRWFTPEFAERHPQDMELFRDQITHTPAEGYAGCCAAIEGFDVREDLARVRAPTLVVAGADDPAAPVAGARTIAERIPGARLEVLEDAAHLLSWQQADKVNALLAEHLAA
nr:3-oxoadipate enol-lactonase [Nocardiopsis algeriensis]